MELQLPPMSLGLLKAAEPGFAEAEPEQTSGFQGRRKGLGWQGTQHVPGPLPLFVQQGFAPFIPLQLPAVAVVGPALQNRERAPAFVEPGAGRGDGGGPLRQLAWDRLHHGWVGEERCHQQPHCLRAGGMVGLLLNECQQMVLPLSALPAVSLQQGSPQGQSCFSGCCRAVQAGLRRGPRPLHAQRPGQLLSLLGRGLPRRTGLTDACSGTRPAPAPTGQVQGPLMPAAQVRIQSGGCGQSCRVSRLPLQ